MGMISAKGDIIMYIFKNALRNISRCIGRNLLIGGIAFIIGLSACLALSIKAAAHKEKASSLANISISASISLDRQSMMDGMQNPPDEQASSSTADMKDKMAEMQEVPLSDMQKYAKSDSVKAFYYTGSTSLNSTTLEAISSSSETSSEQGRGPARMQNQGDFSLIGYSSYNAMTAFSNKSNTLTSGKIFNEDSDELTCIINKELATLNSIKVNDNILLQNPNNTNETYTIKVVGIYTSSTNTENSNGMGLSMNDPANQIYMSYSALHALIKQSTSSSDTTSTAESENTTLKMMNQGTYLFKNIKNYEAFQEEVYDLGLDENYKVQSSDVEAYEKSLEPLVSLSKYATYFLFVFLLIGGVILILLQIYQIRERKYEIGVLAAIGMNKSKIAIQFIIESFTITLIAIMLGTGVGAMSSVPLTNSLLANQSSDYSSQDTFDFRGNSGMQGVPNKPGSEQNIDTIDKVTSATDINVILQLIGISMILTIISGCIAVFTILRFEPLKILSSRE